MMMMMMMICRVKQQWRGGAVTLDRHEGVQGGSSLSLAYTAGVLAF